MPASVSAPSAADLFPLLTVSFFPSFFPLLSFVSLPLTRAAFRNPAGDVFSEKESHSLSDHPDALRAHENTSGKRDFRIHVSESWLSWEACEIKIYVSEY